jgi:predicted transcriptional regulator
MKVAQLVEWFGLEIRAGAAGQEREVRGGYCGDLLSDVMANAPSGSIWLTVQGHLNIVAVALLREMAAIVLTGDRDPDPETVQRAEQEGIPLLKWRRSSYELAGELYALGVGSPPPG